MPLGSLNSSLYYYLTYRLLISMRYFWQTVAVIAVLTQIPPMFESASFNRCVSSVKNSGIAHNSTAGAVSWCNGKPSIAIVRE
jgi:hypothetical protein